MTDMKATASKIHTCSICQRGYTGYGHSAWPVNDGRCCGTCNDTIVLPARMRQAGVIKGEPPESTWGEEQ